MVMDRNGDINSARKMYVMIHNSDGNPAKKKLIQDLIDDLTKLGPFVGIFNDVRIQDAKDAIFDGLATIVRNNPDNLCYAGGSMLVFPSNWTAKEHKIKAKEGFIFELRSPSNETYIVATEYAHPGQYVDKSIFRKIASLNTKNDKKIILAGDFNAAAKEFGSRFDSDQGKSLIDSIAEIGLNYVENSDPTYISRSSGNWNVLDLIFASDSAIEDIVNLDTSHATESDHLPLILTLRNTGQIEERTIKHTNWDKFQNEITKSGMMTDIQRKLDTIKEDHANGKESIENISSRINKLVKDFSTEIVNAKDRASTEKPKNAKKDFKLRRETRQKIKERREIVQLIKANKNIIDVSEIKKRLNRVTNEMRKMLREDKLTHYRNQTELIKSTKDSAKRWKVFNSLMESKKKDNNPLTNLKTKEGNLTSTAKEIVDTHAQRLKETHQPRPPDLADVAWRRQIESDNELHRNLFEPLPFSRKEEGDEEIESIVNIDTVVNIIRDLKTNSAPGDDNIDNATIKRLPATALHCLVNIFNLCFQVGLYPDDWKRARVRMLLKPGKPPDDSASYRPISLLSCLGKILEKIIKIQIDSADSRYKLIPEIHAGFRPKRSTQECFLRLMETAGAARKKKKVVVAAFVDVDKAFDRLNHDVIKYRVRRLPIPRKTVRLIASFLTNRKLYVVDGDICSMEVTMEAGAPQGAILSPTLYIICTMDAPLTNDEDEGSSQYADDTSLWVTANNPREAVALIQRRLDLLEAWCRKWALYPSPAKTELIVLAGTKRQKQTAMSLELTLMNEPISWQENIKFLGVQIDKTQNWKGHIDSLISKSYPKVMSIARLNRRINYASRDIVLSLFDSLIMSSFHYSGLAYVNMPEYSWDRVESFLTRSLKHIFELPMNMSNSHARGIFRNNSFRDDIESFARKRICGLINSSTLTQDMIVNYRDYVDLNGKDTILDRIRKTAGINTVLNCYLCPFGVAHYCVK